MSKSRYTKRFYSTSVVVITTEAGGLSRLRRVHAMRGKLHGGAFQGS
ncbi:MAG: hypothetical protein HRT36_08800 [Alphaproteobacteria bacterium]|nr:hypothetical protein [Alphaproteobacteria bacterium]